MNIKNALTISILIIALSIAYYLVIFLPHKNQQQIDLQKQQLQQQIDLQKLKDQEAQKQSSDAKQALTSCLDTASLGYNIEWRSDCRTQGLLPSGCDENSINISFDDYQKEHNLSGPLVGWADYMKNSSDLENKCTCALPTLTANIVNNDLQTAKDTCFKEYPQK